MDQKTLKEILDYNPETGDFFWKKSNSRAIKKGSKAGGIYSKGYQRICIDGTRYLSHRLAWIYIYGKKPNGQIDHINQIKHDNRICNLREVSNKENAKNQKKRSTNTSGYTGVYWRNDKNKWEAKIKIDGKSIYVGRRKNKLHAHILRKEAEIEYGFHRNHGN